MCNRRLVCKEVVIARSICKKSTYGDLEIPLVLIRQGVSGSKKIWFVYFLKRGKRGEGEVSFSVRGAHLHDWVNGGSVDVFFTYGMVLVLWRVSLILGNVYRIQGQNYVALLQGSTMSAMLHSSNLILGIECFRVPILDVCLWPKG